MTKPQFPADLITFTEEILNGKLHFCVHCDMSCVPVSGLNFILSLTYHLQQNPFIQKYGMQEGFCFSALIFNSFNMAFKVQGLIQKSATKSVLDCSFLIFLVFFNNFFCSFFRINTNLFPCRENCFIHRNFINKRTYFLNR